MGGNRPPACSQPAHGSQSSTRGGLERTRRCRCDMRVSRGAIRHHSAAIPAPCPPHYFSDSGTESVTTTRAVHPATSVRNRAAGLASRGVGPSPGDVPPRYARVASVSSSQGIPKWEDSCRLSCRAAARGRRPGGGPGRAGVRPRLPRGVGVPLADPVPDGHPRAARDPAGPVLRARRCAPATTRSGSVTASRTCGRLTCGWLAAEREPTSGHRKPAGVSGHRRASGSSLGRCERRTTVSARESGRS